MTLTFHEHDPGCNNFHCYRCPTATLRVTSEQELREGLPKLLEATTYYPPESLSEASEYAKATGEDVVPEQYAADTRVLIIEPWEGCIRITLRADGRWKPNGIFFLDGIDRIEIDCKEPGCSKGYLPVGDPAEGIVDTRNCPRCHELREVVE